MLPAAFRDGYPRQVRCGRLLLQVTGAGADAPVLTIAKQGIGVSANALTLVDREAWDPRKR
ncbi:hypothetical protein DF037_10590 [Burkholderia contaminans]|uniref:Uncharacterized protein n=1 Tax=Burkholderia contaminans TaxID=488447 RepID=A0A3N8R8Y7_9BURK|nr:hypothetical protein DF037_10590 [Burkholderia contaminans]VWD53128.1 hypothetical protein BCO18442_06338 [Burkholderia contaminans]